MSGRIENNQWGVVRRYLQGVPIGLMDLDSGYSVPGAEHILNRLGVETKPQQRPLTPVSLRSAALNLSVSDGRSVSEVARLLGLSLSTCHRIFADSEGFRAPAQGVALIVMNQDGRILVHEEKYPNWLARHGYLSIQMTWQGKREPLDGTVRRLIQDEIFGISCIGLDPGRLITRVCDIEVKIVLANVRISLVVVEMTDNGLATPMLSEKVANIRWEDPLVFTGKSGLRPGVAEMVKFAVLNQPVELARLSGELVGVSDLNVQFLTASGTLNNVPWL